MPSIFDDKDVAAPSIFLPAALLREARRQKGLPVVDVARHLHSRSGWRYGPAAAAEWRGTSFQALGLLSYAARYFHPRRAYGRPRRVRGWRPVCRPGCRTAVCQRLPRVDQRHICRTDYGRRAASLFCHHQPGTEGRGDELSLCGTRGIRRSRSASRENRSRCTRRNGATRGRRCDVDDDAPFRETADAIDLAKSKGALAVEMEAAALYAFAASAKARVLCLAHVTNTMAQAGDDFEKGEADGTRDALAVLGKIVCPAICSRRGLRE